MTSLEDRLARLSWRAFPPTPDLAPAVRARIEDERPSRWTRGRLVAIAAAVLAAALAAVLAVPDARSTLRRWLGLGGVEVQLVDRLPAVSGKALVTLGRPIAPALVREAATFGLVYPDAALGEPDRIYIARDGAEVSFLYGRPDSVRLLLTEVDGRLEPAFAKKLVATRTRVEVLQVGGEPALWIEGAPHAFLYLDRRGAVVPGSLRLARNTLIWQRGDLVLRLEGALDRAKALEVAEQLR